VMTSHTLGEKVLVIAHYVVIITGSVSSFSLFIGYFVLGLPFP
jgi:hypothetical protein